MSKDCAVILAAGEGTRMKSAHPKALAEVLFEPMLKWVIDAVKGAGIEDICIVAGYRAEEIEQYIAGKHPVVLQRERLGTGHAVRSATDFLNAHRDGSALILGGDAPFIDSKTISDSLAEHEAGGRGVTVISAKLDEPFGYGRIIRDVNDNLEKIVEEKDATEKERAVTEINSGAYWFSTLSLIDALTKITNNNAKGEYYLTDTVKIIKSTGRKAGAYAAADKSCVLGANTRIQLMELTEIARRKILNKHMLNGVDIPCCDGVMIAKDAEIGTDTRILPGTLIKSGVTIGSFCTIGPNTVLTDTTVGSGSVLDNVTAEKSIVRDNVTMGPYVHLRPGSDIGDGVHVGNFVEVKNSNIGTGTKLPHLLYIGDSDIGKNVNFGCGCVTVNYTGKDKYRTTVKDGAFVGCNTNLVAPVTIGENAYTAAGSTITRDVPDNALAIARTREEIKEDWVTRKKPYKNR